MPETLPASFFVVGGTLRRDAPSYIERAADQILYRSLQARRNLLCAHRPPDG